MSKLRRVVRKRKSDPAVVQQYKISNSLFIMSAGSYFGEPRWTPYYDTLDHCELINTDAEDHGISMRIYQVTAQDAIVFEELREIKKVCIMRYDSGHVKGIKLA